MSLLTRVHDLWTRGKMVHLGRDQNGDVCVWVAAINSFDREDAQRAGRAAQHGLGRQLRDESNPQRLEYLDTLRRMERDELIDALVREYAPEDFAKAVEDVSADEQFRADEEFVLVTEALLTETEASDDDPRREQIADARTRVMAARLAAHERRDTERRSEFMAWTEEALIEDCLQKWVSRISFAEYLAESAAAELFYAIRECFATRDPNEPSVWDHGGCNDHRFRLVATRSEARQLPDHVLVTCKRALDELSITPQDAGKSDGLASSSASSRPPRQPEESTASTPTVTSDSPPGP